MRSKQFEVEEIEGGYVIARKAFRRTRYFMSAIAIAAVAFLTAFAVNFLSVAHNGGSLAVVIIGVLVIIGAAFQIGDLVTRKLDTQIFMLTPDYLFIRNNLRFWDKRNIAREEIKSIQIRSTLKEERHSNDDFDYTQMVAMRELYFDNSEEAKPFLVEKDDLNSHHHLDFMNVLAEHLKETYEIPVLPHQLDPQIPLRIEMEQKKIEREEKEQLSKPWRIRHK